MNGEGEGNVRQKKKHIQRHCGTDNIIYVGNCKRGAKLGPPSFILFYYYYFFLKLINFIFGCVGCSFLCEGFLQLRQAGATLHRGAQASHYRGLSCCGAEAPDAQAQQLWLTGLVSPRHVGSSQTRARTRVPCIGRQTLNHCATREAPSFIFIIDFLNRFIEVYLIHKKSYIFNACSLMSLEICIHL